MTVTIESQSHKNSWTMLDNVTCTSIAYILVTDFPLKRIVSQKVFEQGKELPTN